MKPTIRCPKCHQGKIALSEASPALFETLELVYAGRKVTARDLSEYFVTIGVTAINQRLEDLRKLGLVKRERDGRSWRYSVI